MFLAVESLYSMDGDFAPIPTLLDVMDTYVPRERQCVVVDEAHSTGVYGKGGRGVVYALGENLRGAELEGGGRVGVRLMTFGKAVGCSGGEHMTIGYDTLTKESSRLIMLSNDPKLPNKLCTTIHLFHSPTALYPRRTT